MLSRRRSSGEFVRRIALAQEFRQLGDRPGIQQREKGHVDVEARGHARGDRRRLQGIAAEAENVSVVPTWSSPSTSAHIFASSASSEPAGAVSGASASRRSRIGIGSRRRSVFPFGVCGIASIATKAAGIM